MRTNRINNLTRAAKITKNIFAEIKKDIRPGASEKEIARKIENILKKEGLRRSFKTIVASGPNGAKPHAKVTERRIRKNDKVVIDFGVILKGYHSDMTRTVVVGKATPRMRKIYNTVKTAQIKAIKKCRAGLRICDFVKSVHDYIRNKGCGKFMLHGLGHGLGLRIHEAPKLSEKNRGILKENMVITIEPGLYVKGIGGVRIEDAVLITRKGARVLAP